MEEIKDFQLRLQHMDGCDWHIRDIYEVVRLYRILFDIEFVLPPRIEEQTKSKL